MDDLLREFLTETTEKLAALDTALVTLEQNPGDPELIGAIFRLMHTIKGTCGFINLPRFERLAHAGENILGKFRDRALPVTPRAVTLIFRSIDAIKYLVGELEANQKEPPGDDGSLIGELDAMAAGREVEPAEPHHDLNAAKESEIAAQTIRVQVDQLENLMTTVSELVLTRNQLLQIMRQEKETAFSAPLQRLNQVTSELQENVMKTRMQPIGNAWSRLPRLVRDLAHELGKKVELTMHGGDTELDRQVLELIKDPLTHMIRNAVDHGIEMPCARAKCGKPPTGTIHLGASHEGGHILIEIADDGAGISVEKIKAKALERLLAGDVELGAMPDAQVLQFIFRAGFSTAAQVTAVSGRGVGMDVVKTNIEKIGGKIDLQSAPGKGTRFHMRIPLTLAIVPALIVTCAGERFAVPQIGVTELVRAGGDNRIETINDTPVLRLRDRLLPLISLRRLLKLGEGESDGSFIVVAQAGGASFGIIVDGVHDAEEIVVKPVAPLLRSIKLFSGNTILGDGRVIMILDLGNLASRVGDVQIETALAQPAPAQIHATRGLNRQSLLLFEAGGGAQKAVLLSLIARLEDIDRRTIEYSNGTPVVQYRGKLMPLVAMAEKATLQAVGTQPVLVFADRSRRMGLMVDRIVDIVEDKLVVDLSARKPGYLGTSIIAGRATDIIDVAHFLAQAYRNWFDTVSDSADCHHRVLLVDDSPFFRNLLTPLLTIAGYDVTAVGNPGEAFRLREAGEDFDAIVSDIEMPGMDGFDFAAAIRRTGRWAKIPILGLSAHATQNDRDRGRQIGFTDYIAKFNRDDLLASLQRTLGNGASA